MTGLGAPPGRMAGSASLTNGSRSCAGREARGGGRSGRAIRHRGPRRWPGRLCHRAVRRRRRPDIALVEEDRVGGTCLHRGCIPAKELLQTAEVLRTIQRASDFGIDAGGSPSLDLGRAAGPQAGGRRPAHQGPRDAAEGAQGHRRARAWRGRRRAAGTRARSPTAPRSQGANLVIATGSVPAFAARARLRRHPRAVVRSRARARRAARRGSRSSAVG